MSQKIYFIAIHFFSNNVTSKLGVFNIFKADKINIKCTLQKRNFKVLVFKSRRSFWGHAWCHKKNILLTFKGFCMNFSLELKKIIVSHPVTSKQPHKIVQILMRHPVFDLQLLITTYFTYFLNKSFYLLLHNWDVFWLLVVIGA